MQSKKFMREEHIPLTEAAQFFPGRRPSLATLHRWCGRGVRGVRLESLRVGVYRYTSRKAVERFVEQLNQTDEEELIRDGC